MKILLTLLLLCGSAFGTTYYASYANGADTNNGTSKSTPFKYAPYMAACAHTCASTTLNPGDSVILEGCDSWLNESFPWTPTVSGSSGGGAIYFGVDKTWYDTAVCPSAWNRPIMNLQSEQSLTSDSLQIVFDNRQASYITWDNFEVTNWYTIPDQTSGSYEAIVWHVSSASHGASHNTISNNYVHHWTNPYVSIGTGNITTSCTITNYIPYSYSNSPASSWISAGGGMRLQSLPQGVNIPEGNSSPTLTAISGSNPYTLTYTNTAGCPSSPVTGAVIQIGLDVGVIVSGNSAGDPGTIVQQNVFDGSDTAEAQWNTPVTTPTQDCSSNTEACVASVEAGRQGPQIWRDNVIRYVSNGFIGSSSEMSGNLIEYIRLGTDPTGHTNYWEDQPCLGNTCLYYGNVIRHGNWLQQTGIPGGAGQIGVPLMVAPASSSSTAYVFNNVIYDMTQNTVVEINSLEGLVGTVDLWNNTIEGGPDSGPNYNGFSCTVTTCGVYNNFYIGGGGTPWGTCGTGCTHTTLLALSKATANSDGYTISQTYAFSPTSSGNPTVGQGTNLASTCSTLSGLNALAGTACLSDTPYAVGYNTTTHSVIIPDRTPNLWPSSGAWDVGAYEYQASLPNGIGIAPGVGLGPGVAIAP
jgi:hypothetical protein